MRTWGDESSSRLILVGTLLYLFVTDLIWIGRDTRPPFWDMAYHLSSAVRIYDAFADSGLKALAVVPGLTGYYPPLFQSVVAAFWFVFGRTVAVSRLANLPAIAILLFSTYGIGRKVLPPIAAATAAALANFYPLMLWLSRETIIDYWLTAMVALSMYVLLTTEAFSDRRRSVLFGVVCGFGMLTKWSFPFFVFLPAVWLARRNCKNAALAGAVAAAIAAYWYVPFGGTLREFLALNAAGGISEGDPKIISWQAIVFYVRALEGYQLFLPLFVVFLAGFVVLFRRPNSAWIPLLLWILGGWSCLMLFRNKDPRYTAPLLPAIALITAQVVTNKRTLATTLLVFLVPQHYIVSFGTRLLPEVIVFAHGPQGPDSYNWNVYSQNYFGLWGKPAREDWKIQYVLDRLTAVQARPLRLGMIPDIPRFDSLAFQFYIDMHKQPVRLNRLGKFDVDAILDDDYVLLSESDQGFASFVAPEISKLNAHITNRQDKFDPVDRFRLPNGDVIRLYRVLRSRES